jgi:hypothetical protein
MNNFLTQNLTVLPFDNYLMNVINNSSNLEINSVWNLVNLYLSYEQIFPILVSSLDNYEIGDIKTLEGVIRSLSINEVRKTTAVLNKLILIYLEFSTRGANLAWVTGNAINIISTKNDTKYLDILIEYSTNSNYGYTR